MKSIKRNPEYPWFNEELGKLCKEWGKEWGKKDKGKELTWHKKSYKKWEQLCAQEWEKLKKEYEETKDQQLLWPKKDSLSLNEVFLPFLRKMTHKHCSFCNARVGVGRSEETIEHFKPKSNPEYKTIAYQWENLFLSCNTCQKAKMWDFSKDLLKPDSKDYQFEKYFKWDFDTGELLPNPKQPKENQERAQVTIDLYKLNKEEYPRERRRELELYQGYKKRNQNQPSTLSINLRDPNEYSYSFYIQEYIKRYGDIDCY